MADVWKSPIVKLYSKEQEPSFERTIVPDGMKADWLAARKIAEEKGGLPPYALHDDILARSTDWARFRGYYPAWARELLVYPAPGKVFERGRNVVDATKDKNGRYWIFPATCIPEKALGKKGVGLFVTPIDVVVKDQYVIIIAEPKSVFTLDNFIQDKSGIGIVDEVTRIPLRTDRATLEKLDETEKRSFWRVTTSGVRPICTGFDLADRDFRCGPITNIKVSGTFGVGHAEAIDTAIKVDLHSRTPDQLRTLIRDARANLNELLKTEKPERLDGIRRLLRVLGVKS